MDRISLLPELLMHEILSRLPVKDAARTSLLSKEWRHKWRSLPSLVFDGKSFPICSIDYKSKPGPGSKARLNELERIVYRVLLLHSGPINKFHFTAQEGISHRVFDRWISCLPESFVRDFAFWIFACTTKYPLPPCFFSFENLTRLQLRECVFVPPPGFQGFRNLKTLLLDRTHSTQGVCEKLISSTRVLETLTLWDVFDVHSLDIDSPSLRFLVLRSQFRYVRLGNNPSLEEVVIDSTNLLNSPTVLQDILSLPNLKKLYLWPGFMLSLFENVSPGGEHPVCVSLKYLKIYSYFCSRQLHIIGPYLLRSAPYVEELKINLYESFYDETKLLVDINSCFTEAEIGGLSFNNLRHIKLKGVVGCHTQIDFINYMLSASPVLETMTVKFHDLLVFASVKKLRFRPAVSRLAQLILEWP